MLKAVKEIIRRSLLVFVDGCLGVEGCERDNQEVIAGVCGWMFGC